MVPVHHQTAEKGPYSNRGAHKGYSAKEIADKTAHSLSYINGILTLLHHGEERLLTAVAQRRVPINVAMTIVKAGDDDKSVQLALQDAYESGSLRGERLEQARKLIERRKTLGRSIGNRALKGKKAPEVSGCSLVRTYQKEVTRQKLMVKKAEYAQQRLLFVVGALRSLCGDENFGYLLRAEGLDTLPAYLAERVWPSGGMA